MSLTQAMGKRLFFTVRDVAEAVGIRPASARVLCVRAVRRGTLVRVRNNFYVLAARWEGCGREEFIRMANFLQVPSYLSFLSALAYWEATTQVPREVYESACLRRTRHLEVRGVEFRFYKVKRDRFGGSLRRDGLFVASAEKAFLDAAYLASFGRYRLDTAALEWGRLDRAKIRRALRAYPSVTRRYVRRSCGI